MSAEVHEANVRWCQQAEHQENEAARLVGRAPGPVGLERGKWRDGLIVKGHAKAAAHLKCADGYRWRIALSIERLIWRWAQSHPTPAISTADKVQEGLIGAYRGAIRWDPSQHRFPTYGMWWAQSFMRRAGEPMQPIYAGMNASSDRSLIRRADEPGLSDEQVAERTGLALSRVAGLRHLPGVVSTDTIVPGTKDLRLGDIIEAEAEEDVAGSDVASLHRAMARLTHGERRAIQAWMTGGGPTTISDELGLSHQRMSQLYHNALQKLRIQLNPTHRSPS